MKGTKNMFIKAPKLTTKDNIRSMDAECSVIPSVPEETENVLDEVSGNASLEKEENLTDNSADACEVRENTDLHTITDQSIDQQLNMDDVSSDNHEIDDVKDASPDGEKTEKLALGQRSSKVLKKSNSNKKYKEDSITQRVYDFIYDNYGLDNNFLTEELYEHFRQHNAKGAQIAGQLYALKNQGYLVCSELSPEDKKTIRNNLKWWRLVKERSS